MTIITDTTYVKGTTGYPWIKSTGKFAGDYVSGEFEVIFHFDLVTSRQDWKTAVHELRVKSVTWHFDEFTPIPSAVHEDLWYIYDQNLILKGLPFFKKVVAIEKLENLIIRATKDVVDSPRVLDGAYNEHKNRQAYKALFAKETPNA